VRVTPASPVLAGGSQSHFGNRAEITAPVDAVVALVARGRATAAERR
jgi:hypothetical protein